MRNRNKPAEMIKGMGWLLLCHAGFLTIAFLYPGQLMLYAALAIGLTQLLYAIPLCLYFGKKRRFSALKGVVLGAILTVVLTLTLYVTVLDQLLY